MMVVVVDYVLNTLILVPMFLFLVEMRSCVEAHTVYFLGWLGQRAIERARYIDGMASFFFF
jgi:hypothetical protein